MEVIVGFLHGLQNPMYAIKKTEVGAQIWLVPLKIVFNNSRFKAALN